MSATIKLSEDPTLIYKNFKMLKVQTHNSSDVFDIFSFPFASLY